MWLRVFESNFYKIQCHVECVICFLQYFRMSNGNGKGIDYKVSSLTHGSSEEKHNVVKWDGRPIPDDDNGTYT